MKHILLEQCSEFDKNINTLSKIKLDCMLNKKFGVCLPQNCESCVTHQKYTHCYQQLPICDQLRVDSLASDKYAVMSYTISRNKRKDNGFKIFIFVILLLFIFAILKLSAEPYYKNDKQIVNVLSLTHSQVTDINEDGMINCIDYAVTFKKIWDKFYNPKHCEIIRNRNNTKDFHHLFNVVFTEGGAFYVEPQAFYFNYKMEDYWGDKYNYTYNIYGETQKWLNQ